MPYENIRGFESIVYRDFYIESPAKLTNTIESLFFLLWLDLNATVCPENEADGIIWNLTPAGYTNLKDCTAGFTGYHHVFQLQNLDNKVCDTFNCFILTVFRGDWWSA